MRCQHCGAGNRTAARFCDQCGTRLAGGAPEAVGGVERRQLTVMFCDLVDSSVLAERFDPEELRPLIEAYQEAAGEVIGRLGGHVAQYLGDGLLVYFGYPHAEEDDARRAIRAGLDVLQAIDRLNARLAAEVGVRLAVRVGIHTGTVVVGELGGAERRERLALGGTLNVAARLQAIAAPGSVVVSEATRRLAPGAFRYSALGPQVLKGISTSVPAYRVVGEALGRGGVDVPRAAGLTPFVGRAEEIALLLDRWERARQGTGQVVLLAGEAGIGKSRLALALRERLATTSHAALHAACVAHGRGSPLHPLIDLLERMLQLARDESAEARCGKLESAARDAGLPLAEAVPLLAALLSVPLGAGYRPPGLGAERQRRRTHEILLALLCTPASARPLLLVVEDLHWADPSTLELLGRLIEQEDPAPVLTVLTHRPEFRPPWSPRSSRCTGITVGRLSAEHARLMVGHVAGEGTLPAAIVEQVVAKTDGVPLFIEELTKMVVDTGPPGERGRLEPAIPATLRDSLMARLDRLGPAKEVAQLAAVVGRVVPLALLRAIASMDDAGLEAALARIVEAEVLLPANGGETAYVFKHTLIQEAAYDSLLRTIRQEHHRRIAETLEVHQPELADSGPELLAHHYTEAGRPTEAIRWWHRAAEKALERSADAEAAAHAMRGLGLLVGCEESAARDQQELFLQTTLGAALMVTEGYASPRVERAYGRARALCQRVGETPQLFSVLRGLYVPYLLQGKLQVAHELAEQLLRLARAGEDVAAGLEAHFAFGQTLLFRGEFAAAREHLEQGVALHDQSGSRSHAFRYGQDSAVSCAALLAHALQALGLPDRALERGEQAVTLARSLAHPSSLAAALFFVALLYVQRREPRRAGEHARELLALAEEQGLPFWAGAATALLGAAAADADDGIARLQEGLTALRVAGAHLLRPLLLPLLAEALGRAGRVEEGLRIVDEALFVVTQNGELVTAAELHRVKGELLGMEGAAEAEASVRQSLEFARDQDARWFELRSAVSLVRLIGPPARPALAATYTTFTEGLETADLKEAAAMLRSLDAGPDAFR